MGKQNLTVILFREWSIGDARGDGFVTKLDLLKGYWQVGLPLTEQAKEISISAFVTPDDVLQ